MPSPIARKWLGHAKETGDRLSLPVKDVLHLLLESCNAHTFGKTNQEDENSACSNRPTPHLLSPFASTLFSALFAKDPKSSAPAFPTLHVKALGNT